MAISDRDIQALYIGFLGRPADVAGLSAWKTSADISEAARTFPLTEEYRSLFSDKELKTIITQIHENLFHRGASETSLTYWTKAINDGQSNIPDLFSYLITNASGSDAACLQSKLNAAELFTKELTIDTRGNAYQGEQATFLARNQWNSIYQDSVQPENYSDLISNMYSYWIDKVQKVYITYLARPADPEGLKVWVNYAIASGGDWARIGESFAASAESKAIYGEMNSKSLVTSIYKNVLGRAPEEEGLTTWSNALDGGAFTYGSIAFAISDNASGLDADIIKRRVDAANEFTSQIEQLGKQSDYFGLDTSRVANQWLNSIGPDDIDYESAMDALPSILGSFNKGMVKGFVINGYIADATIFIDSDSDGVLDADEISVKSDAGGSFVFPNGTPNGTIIAFGGTNITTGQANTQTIKASAGSITVTPLTNLVHELVASGLADNVAKAESLVKEAFSIPKVNLSSFDPLKTALNGSASEKAIAIEIEAATTKLANSKALAGSLLQSAGLSANEAQAAITKAVIQSISEGTKVDFTQKDTIESVIKSAAIYSGLNNDNMSQISNAISVTSEVLSELNTRTDEASEAFAKGTNDNPISALSDLFKIATLVQKDVTSAIQQSFDAGKMQELKTNFSGSNLDKSLSSTSAGLISPEIPTNRGTSISGGGTTSPTDPNSGNGAGNVDRDDNGSNRGGNNNPLNGSANQSGNVENSTSSGNGANQQPNDVTPPQFRTANGTPSDNANNIAVFENITLRFSEALSGAASNLNQVVLKKTLTNEAIPTVVSIINGELVLDPISNLDYRTSYHINWGAGALKDAAGNSVISVLDNSTFNFETYAETNLIVQYYKAIFRTLPSSSVLAAYSAMASEADALTSMLFAANVTVDPLVRLSQLGFNRLPDDAWLTAWVNQYSTGAISLVNIANGMTQSAEFLNLYPASMSNAQYVGSLFYNVLQRAGEDAAFANWVNLLNSGALTRGQVLLAFSESAEFKARVEPAVDQFLTNIALTPLANQGDPGLYTGSLFGSDQGGAVPASIVAQYYTAIFREAPSAAVAAAYSAMASEAAALTSMLSAANTSVDPLVRLCQVGFNRLPDNAWLTAWVNQYSTGATTLVNIANGMTQSAEFLNLYPASMSNAQYVSALFYNVLQRAGEDAAIATWVNSLDSGALTRGQVLLAFSESAEFKARVEPAVDQFLTNIALTPLADQGNPSLYTGSLFDGNQGGAVSPAIVQQYYTAIFRAAPSEVVSLAYSSMPNEASVLNSMLSSANFVVDPLVRLYQAGLNKVPDSSWLTEWVVQFSNGNKSLVEIADAITQSSEFVNLYSSLSNTGYVSALFYNILQRDGDPADIQYWVDALSSGTVSRGQVLLAFSESAEFKARVEPAVDQFLTNIALTPLVNQGDPGLYTGSLFDSDQGGAVPASIVAQYYTAIFREAPSAAVAAAYSAMANEASALTSMLSAANVSVDPLVRLCQVGFNRLPDDAWLTAWVNQYSTGAISLVNIANGMTQSVEFLNLYPASMSNAQYVGALFNNVLQRAGEDADIANWVDFLNSGALTRGQVLLAFSESAEFKARVEPAVDQFLTNIALTPLADQGDPSLYTGSLFDGDQGGAVSPAIVQQYYTAIFRAAPSEVVSLAYSSMPNEASVLNSMLSSANFVVDPLVRLYQAGLNKVPDSSWLTEWVVQFSNGNKSLVEIADAITQSSEFVNLYSSLSNTGYVSALFYNILQRDGDPADIQYWVDALSSGTVSRAQVLLNFAESTEFKDRVEPAVNDFLSQIALTPIANQADPNLYAGSLFDFNEPIVSNILTSRLDDNFYEDLKGTNYIETGIEIIGLLNTNIDRGF